MFQLVFNTPIWDFVTKLYLYDPITAVASVDHLREHYFSPYKIMIKDSEGNPIEHQLIGLTKENHQVRLPGSLRSFIWDHMMWSLFMSIELQEQEKVLV